MTLSTSFSAILSDNLPRLDVLKGEAPIRVHTNPVPLHGAPLGVLSRLLILKGPTIVPDPSGTQREEHHGAPAPQIFLHRLLPHLPDNDRLRDRQISRSKQSPSVIDRVRREILPCKHLGRGRFRGGVGREHAAGEPRRQLWHQRRRMRGKGEWSLPSEGCHLRTWSQTRRGRRGKWRRSGRQRGEGSGGRVKDRDRLGAWRGRQRRRRKRRKQPSEGGVSCPLLLVVR